MVSLLRPWRTLRHFLSQWWRSLGEDWVEPSNPVTRAVYSAGFGAGLSEAPLYERVAWTADLVMEESRRRAEVRAPDPATAEAPRQTAAERPAATRKAGRAA